MPCTNGFTVRSTETVHGARLHSATDAASHPANKSKNLAYSRFLGGRCNKRWELPVPPDSQSPWVHQNLAPPQGLGNKTRRLPWGVGPPHSLPGKPESRILLHKCLIFRGSFLPSCWVAVLRRSALYPPSKRTRLAPVGSAMKPVPPSTPSPAAPIASRNAGVAAPPSVTPNGNLSAPSLSQTRIKPSGLSKTPKPSRTSPPRTSCSPDNSIPQRKPSTSRKSAPPQTSVLQVSAF